MRNEQCGICWDLKFDKQGKTTHGILHSHDFLPLDFCIKCRQPKFDHQGFLTHPSVYDIRDSKIETHHEFVSAINNKINSQKKKKIIFLLVGIASIVATANINLINLLN